MKDFLKKYNSWIVLLLCVLIFGILLRNVLTNSIGNFDEIAYSLIMNNKNQFLIVACMVLAKIGGRGGIAIITIMFSLICIAKYKNKKVALIVIINILGIGLLNHILKDTIQRPRPEYRMMEVVGYSFPSGHSMGAMGLWGMFIVLTYKYVIDKKLKTCLICLMSLMILAMGASRIYLGVHYLSDVLAGFSIGLAYLITYIKIIDYIQEKKKIRLSGIVSEYKLKKKSRLK